MKIYLNEQPAEMQEGVSLFAVLSQSGLQGKKGIAVAVNDLVIGKEAWESFSLREADKVTVITATQGG
jgi:sulfur carrier protein